MVIIRTQIASNIRYDIESSYNIVLIAPLTIGGPSHGVPTRRIIIAVVDDTFGSGNLKHSTFNVVVHIRDTNC